MQRALALISMLQWLHLYDMPLLSLVILITSSRNDMPPIRLAYATLDFFGGDSPALSSVDLVARLVVRLLFDGLPTIAVAAAVVSPYSKNKFIR